MEEIQDGLDNSFSLGQINSHILWNTLLNWSYANKEMEICKSN